MGSGLQQLHRYHGAVHGLGVAAYDSRKGVVETPELIELDFRFLLLLSERRSLCLSSAKIGALNVEIWQCIIEYQSLLEQDSLEII